MSEDCRICNGRLEDPPKGWDEGLRRLIWNLREWGYPINRDSIDILSDYLNNIDVPAEELEYHIVAQAISQNYDIDFDTRNSVCDRHYLEAQGMDTENLSDVGVQLVLNDFKSQDYAAKY